MIDYNLKNCNGYRYIPGDLPEVIEQASPCAQRLWFYLIRKVECRQGKKILIGQTISNYEKLLTGISWIERGKTKTFTIKQIRNAIAYLKKEGIISVKQLPGGSLGFLITFNEYRYLQTWENYKKEKGQGVETPRQANANGFDAFKNEKGQGVGDKGQGVNREKGQGVEASRQANINGVEAFENEKGQGVNCEKGQAMSILTTTPGDKRVLYNNIYTRIIRAAENNENFNDNDNFNGTDGFEGAMMQYNLEMKEREGYSFDPDADKYDED
jgi:hypothetical protein